MLPYHPKRKNSPMTYTFHELLQKPLGPRQIDKLHIQTSTTYVNWVQSKWLRGKLLSSPPGFKSHFVTCSLSISRLLIGALHELTADWGWPGTSNHILAYSMEDGSLATWKKIHIIIHSRYQKCNFDHMPKICQIGEKIQQFSQHRYNLQTSI